MTRTDSRTRTLLALTAVLGLGMATVSCDGGDGTSAAPGGAGGASYSELDITLPDINGDDITITSATKDDVHVLCFWAVWCTPCQAELTKLHPEWEKMKDRGLNVYAISIDGPDTQARVTGFAQQQGWKYPILLDRETEVLARYNPKGDIPFYVVLDADGNVLKQHQGYVKGDMENLKKFLDETLPPAGE